MEKEDEKACSVKMPAHNSRKNGQNDLVYPQPGLGEEESDLGQMLQMEMDHLLPSKQRACASASVSMYIP